MGPKNPIPNPPEVDKPGDSKEERHRGDWPPILTEEDDAILDAIWAKLPPQRQQQQRPPQMERKMINASEVEILAQHCRATLDLANAKLGAEYSYPSMPLCIIDAVFSISARYGATLNVVRRFCDHFGVAFAADAHPVPPSEQLSIQDFLVLYQQHGVEGMAQIYQNRQRTSTRNGILKAEAVWRFAQVVGQFAVNYFQDGHKIIDDSRFEAEIKQIPGQRSGISLSYFYMLIGADDYVKPDRMLQRFTETAIGRSLTLREIREAIVKASASLRPEYPALTPKALDHAIWNYQRSR